MKKHIFFDLDRTLWDFEKNSHETLLELINRFKLSDYGVANAEDFICKYKIHNDILWSLYREEKITKVELRTKRFRLALEEYQIFDTKLAESFGNAYVEESPLKTKLFPFAKEVIEYLYDKYQLHIITNGFQEVQHIKLEVSNISQYFQIIITSEQVGNKKPDPRIFNYALKQAKANNRESIMIGDDLEVDIIGAREFGMDQVYFNPHKDTHNQEVTHEISCLSQLKEIL